MGEKKEREKIEKKACRGDDGWKKKGIEEKRFTMASFSCVVLVVGFGSFIWDQTLFFFHSATLTTAENRYEEK